MKGNGEFRLSGAGAFVIAFVGLCSGMAVGEESAPDAGQLAYQMNCMACHLLDTQVVGPSLVKVAEYYPEGKREEFIAWAKAPGKRDPKLLQMPPMAHISDETLSQIYDYILTATIGLEEKKRSTLFTPFKEPEREFPYVARKFLPDTSPASFAVILKDNISVCWDAEACRFRYAWSGSDTKLPAGHSVGKLPSKPYYYESSKRFWAVDRDEEPEFLGYRLIEGYPEFEYAIGKLNVREILRNGPAPGSFTRTFVLSEPVPELTLNLEPTSSNMVTSDKGSLEGGVLTLTGEETRTFTLTVTQP